MKLLCTLSVTVRLAGLAFFVGLVIGLALGYRAVDGAAEPGRTPAAAVPLPAGKSPSSPPFVRTVDSVNATDVPEVDKKCMSG